MFFISNRKPIWENDSRLKIQDDGSMAGHPGSTRSATPEFRREIAP
jgi:hypothetical protein